MPTPSRIAGYELPPELAGTILDQIVAAKLHDLAGTKAKLPAAALEGVLDRNPEARSLETALRGQTPAVIAEIKRRSPSAGLLRPELDAPRIAAEYEAAGAAAISVVTEGRFFHGNLELIAALRWRCRVPLLRKDFIVERYQLLESRHAGADAVLLLAALHRRPALAALREQAEDLGMDALIEVHDQSELERALEAGARLVGVNNRDLRTFAVSLDTALGLAARIPPEVVAVAESGIKSGDDIARLRAAGYRGFLVGEQLMRAPSPGAALRELVGRPPGGSRVA
jgi:indole-3-glycerol phosphate synthase